ncbi:MAG: adenylate/guanylate cyclase domain-containing protein [Betaproteobacteria bacterium]|nr:adenylate/guanylate cyclase domain-containing protein [Betaproteobacteria bacterium]
MRAIERTDTEEQKLKKNLLIFACGLMSFGVVLWLAIYWAMGLQFSTTIPLVYQLISVSSLAYYLVKRNFESFRNIQLSLFLFVPFVMQWSIGNAVTSSGVMLWALLAPLGAVFFHGWRESIPWFIAYLVLTAVSGFIDFYLASGRESGIPLPTIAIFFGLNFAAISTIVYLLVRYFVAENEKIKRRLDLEHAMLQEAQDKSERLLLNVLPEHIATRLKQSETTIADGLADVTVMFADIVNFTKLTEEMAPEEMVALLNKVFSNFDFLLEKYGLEKIKTVGDAYMAAGGLTRGRTDYVQSMAELALEMRTLVSEHPALKRHNLSIHLGIATGPVVAGVIGTKRFIYDLWGDTVNIASRLTTEGVPGRIQVDRITYARLRNRFQFEGPFTVTVKGKGELTVYRLIGRLPQSQGLAAGA